MYYSSTIANADGHHRTVEIARENGGEAHPFRITELVTTMDDDEDLFTPIRTFKGKISIVNQHENPYFYQNIAGSMRVGNTIRIIRDDGVVEFMGRFLNEVRDQPTNVEVETYELNFVSRLGLADQRSISVPGRINEMRSMLELVQECMTLCEFGTSDSIFIPDTLMEEGRNPMDICTALKALVNVNDNDASFVVSGEEDAYIKPFTCQEVLSAICTFFGVTLMERGEYLVAMPCHGRNTFDFYASNTDISHLAGVALTAEPYTPAHLTAQTKTILPAARSVSVKNDMQKTDVIFDMNALKFDRIYYQGAQLKESYIAQDASGDTTTTDYFYNKQQSKDKMTYAVGTVSVADDGTITKSDCVTFNAVTKQTSSDYTLPTGRLFMLVDQGVNPAIPYKGYIYVYLNKTRNKQAGTSVKWRVTADLYDIDHRTNRFTSHFWGAYKTSLWLQFYNGNAQIGQPIRMVPGDASGKIEKHTLDRTVDIPAATINAATRVRIYPQEGTAGYATDFASDALIANLKIVQIGEYETTFTGDLQTEANSSVTYVCNNGANGGEDYSVDLQLHPSHQSYSKIETMPLFWSKNTYEVLDGLRISALNTNKTPYEQWLVLRTNAQLAHDRTILTFEDRLGTINHVGRPDDWGFHPEWLPSVAQFRVVYDRKLWALTGMERDYLENKDTYKLQEIIIE